MDLAAIEAERARLHDEYIKADRPESSARGIHHTALLSSDVERTIRSASGSCRSAWTKGPRLTAS